MCKTFNVDDLSDLGIISLIPLYMIPSSHVIRSLKYQYDCILWGQSLIVLGHPSWTVFATSLNDGSFSVASCNSCSLSGLAGAVCVIWCTGIFSMLLRLSLQFTCSDLRDATLERASAITFSFPLKYSMCTSYCASLKSSLCSLGLDVAIVFFQILVNG